MRGFEKKKSLEENVQIVQGICGFSVYLQN